MNQFHLPCVLEKGNQKKYILFLISNIFQIFHTRIYLFFIIFKLFLENLLRSTNQKQNYIQQAKCLRAHFRCMWNFTRLYVHQEGLVPKFFGRWPLIRYFGMLEPASSIASFVSLLFSCLGFWWLRKFGHPCSPYKWCYNTIFTINCFTWLSSTLFHIRDLFIFERMDYYGAFITTFVPLFWFVCRNFYFEFKILFFAAISFVAMCFIADVLYMELVKFDHTLHFSVCTGIAILGFGFWLIWCVFNLKKVPHAKLYLMTYLSFAVGPLTAKYFEWQPPYQWVYDAHSIFHILTSPTPFLFWWVISIDDIYLTTYKRKIV